MSRATQVEALSLLKSSEDACTLQIEYDVTVHGELAPPVTSVLHCLIPFGWLSSTIHVDCLESTHEYVM